MPPVLSTQFRGHQRHVEVFGQRDERGVAGQGVVPQLPVVAWGRSAEVEASTRTPHRLTTTATGARSGCGGDAGELAADLEVKVVVAGHTVDFVLEYRGE